jgi:hypothetical protein
MTLEEGDVILTGTPSGVGGLHGGDVIEAGIADISQIIINSLLVCLKGILFNICSTLSVKINLLSLIINIYNSGLNAIHDFSTENLI